MPAYNKGNTSLESYLVKILAAICRQCGGELRIKGEYIDQINQPVTLLKDWDSSTQQLVLRTHMGEFGEVFRAIPERQPTQEVIAVDPIRPNGNAEEPKPKRVATTLDDEKLANMESMARKMRLAREIRQEMRMRREEANAG